MMPAAPAAASDVRSVAIPMSNLTNTERLRPSQEYGESDAELVRIRQEMRDVKGRRDDSLEEAASGEPADSARAGDPSFQVR